MPLPTVDCFYSLSSPWAYLGGPQTADIVQRYHVNLVLKPYDFQAVVPHTGGIPLKTRPEARRSYHALELDRWRKSLGLPLNLEPTHYPKGAATDPNWNKYAGWMVIAAQNQFQAGAGPHPFVLSHALLRALWAEERDTSLPEVRVAVANENGYDGAKLLDWRKQAARRRCTRTSAKRRLTPGCLGPPPLCSMVSVFGGKTA